MGVESWDEVAVAEFLKSLAGGKKGQEISQIVLNHAISGPVLLAMSEADVAALGIADSSHQEMICSAALELRSVTSAATVGHGSVGSPSAHRGQCHVRDWGCSSQDGRFPRSSSFGSTETHTCGASSSTEARGSQQPLPSPPRTSTSSVVGTKGESRQMANQSAQRNPPRVGVPAGLGYHEKSWSPALAGSRAGARTLGTIAAIESYATTSSVPPQGVAFTPARAEPRLAPVPERSSVERVCGKASLRNTSVPRKMDHRPYWRG